MADDKKNIIGRAELVDFPELDLFQVRAKIDTGAYRSTIHCKTVEVTPEGLLKIVFDAEEYGLEEDSVVTFDDFSTTNVTSSNGISEERFIVDTVVILGNIERTITISFSKREKLRNPVLLGRLFLKKHHLLVNPRTKNVLSRDIER